MFFLGLNPVALKKALGGIISENVNSRGNSVCGAACLPSQNKEEAKLSESVLKTKLQAVPVNIIPPPAAQQASDQSERKRVKIKEEFDRTMTKENRSDVGPSSATRSVSTHKCAKGSQHRPASLFYSCMNYAILFFIYFLSVACSVIPQFQLPSLKILKFFQKEKSNKE